MKERILILKQLKLCKYMIIGSHDSTAYRIDFTVSFWKSGRWEMLRKLARALPCVASRIKAMTLTQTKEISDQLSCGINAFDIRVAYGNDGQFWCCHTFATIPLNDFFSQLGSHKSKIIIVRLDYNSGDSARNRELELLDFISARLGENICLYLPFDRNIRLPHNISLLREENIIWLNAQTAADFKEKYESRIFDPAGDILCSALTPSTKATFNNIFRLNLRNLAESLKFVIEDIEKDKKAFISIKDFV